MTTRLIKVIGGVVGVRVVVRDFTTEVGDEGYRAAVAATWEIKVSVKECDIPEKLRMEVVSGHKGG